ncbi:ankyrin repeat domain-containing protein [Pedobacter hiemivivus]|uniref:Ankyrin repeat domain-containing protein n=1 Tax=Pedobacter hiemivivus TaxID=2530454 RepID=A0A4R0MAC1_9SPHI|nr:ankyrin repeat domain-containing protein [Pedobacter hiemivivus]TCC82694.1 ankyrin repeat domain-containing protein [Pedobacter hiemivivus]
MKNIINFFILTFVIFFSGRTVAQQVYLIPKNLQWSSYIPIFDQNENKILFSWAAEQPSERKNGVRMWLQVKNTYNESISGRFVYTYTDTKGTPLTNSFVINSAETNEVNFFYVFNLQEITGLYFVEFKPSKANTSLISYNVRDTSGLFKVLREKLNKIQDTYAALKKESPAKIEEKNSETSDQDMQNLGKYLLSAAAMLSNPSKSNYASFLQSSGTMMDIGTGNNLTTNLLKTAGLAQNNNALYYAPTVSGKQFSQMNSFEQRAVVENVANQVGEIIDLLTPKEDEDGLTNRDKKVMELNVANRITENADLKSRYGYDMDDFIGSIRNFDNDLLDKILEKGFPVGLHLLFTKETESREQNIDMRSFVWKKTERLMKPIHYAAIYGNVYAVRLLIAKGADINVQTFTRDGYNDPFGFPLGMALFLNKYEVARFLFEYGGRTAVKNAVVMDFLKARLEAEKNGEMRKLLAEMIASK